MLHIQLTVYSEISVSRNKLPMLAVPESKGYTISDQAWDFATMI